MPTNSVKGFKVGNEVKKYDYNELDNLPENNPDDLAEEVNDLKSDLNRLPFVEYNIFEKPDTVYNGKAWLRGNDLAMTDDADEDIYRVVIDSSKKYYLFKPSGTAYSNDVRYADSSNAFIATSNGLNHLDTPPTNAYYMYFRVPSNELPVAVSEEYLQNYNNGYRTELSGSVYYEPLDNTVERVDNIEDSLADILTPSANLADPSKFTLNKYMTDTGAVGNSNTYFYTDKIPVAEGDVLYWKAANKRYVTAFNGATVVTLESSDTPLTIPQGVTDIVLTGYMSSVNSFMVSKNKNLPFIPYGETINNDHLCIDNKNVLNGNDGITLSADTLSADTTAEITDYPKIIASHDRICGYCKFASLGEIFFGYGYGTNKYCSVDATNINIYTDGTLSKSVAHGITVSDYLSFSIIMNNERSGLITINSIGGSAMATIDLGYNKDGLPFIRSTTDLTSVKLSAICADIKNPIWWFGDSYSSNAPERVIGQLKNYCIIDKMLIDAVPGGRSYYNATTGGYNEFLKLVKLAKPKYIIWALGMNDNETNYKRYLRLVKDYCDEYGITLYAVKIPSVPRIDNTGKAAYIDELGINTIDWASAVNATSQGVWYEDFLSSDNVHPTTLGAQAIAARTIVDCPAIMQFN